MKSAPLPDGGVKVERLFADNAHPLRVLVTGVAQEARQVVLRLSPSVSRRFKHAVADAGQAEDVRAGELREPVAGEPHRAHRQCPFVLLHVGLHRGQAGVQPRRHRVLRGQPEERGDERPRLLLPDRARTEQLVELLGLDRRSQLGELAAHPLRRATRRGSGRRSTSRSASRSPPRLPPGSPALATASCGQRACRSGASSPPSISWNCFSSSSRRIFHSLGFLTSSGRCEELGRCAGLRRGLALAGAPWAEELPPASRGPQRHRVRSPPFPPCRASSSGRRRPCR